MLLEIISPQRLSRQIIVEVILVEEFNKNIDAILSDVKNKIGNIALNEVLICIVKSVFFTVSKVIIEIFVSKIIEVANTVGEENASTKEAKFNND